MPTLAQAKDAVKAKHPQACSSKHRRRGPAGESYWLVMTSHRNGIRIGTGSTEREAWISAQESVMAQADN